MYEVGDRVVSIGGLGLRLDMSNIIQDSVGTVVSIDTKDMIVTVVWDATPVLPSILGSTACIFHYYDEVKLEQYQ